MTIVSTSNVKVGGNIRYQDGQGQHAYLYGSDSSYEYQPNPKFARDHSLAIIAAGDIRYGAYSGKNLEINGALISTTGSVGIEGVESMGDELPPMLIGNPIVLDSFRRFGSVMCNERPVVSLTDADGNVVHGYTSGVSFHDPMLQTTPPPAYPEAPAASLLPCLHHRGHSGESHRGQ